MATKPTDSDAFNNPLYDELLEFFHRNIEEIVDDRWARPWNGKEVGPVPIEHRNEMPTRPAPQVGKVVWQNTLKKRGS